MLRTDWPKLKELDRLVLREGPGDGVVLPIAPTMRYLTYAGERYFRMDKSRARIDGSYAGAYLWERYWDYTLFFAAHGARGAQRLQFPTQNPANRERRIAMDDETIEIKSDVYPDGDGASWSLRTPDGRTAEGRAPSVDGAQKAMHDQLDEWYPDNEGQVTIVRLVP